jgi:hypothetical protein
MNRPKKIAMVLSLTFLFAGMSIPGCQKDDQLAIQVQSLNNDMTQTKAMLQQVTAAIEMQNRRIAMLEQRSAAKPAAPAKKAPPAKKGKGKKH